MVETIGYVTKTLRVAVEDFDCLFEPDGETIG